MIKVIIFDADGVLIPTKRRFSKTLAEKHDISLEKTLPFFVGPFQECLVGDKDLKETVAPYLNEWGWSKGVDALLDYWFKLESELDADLIQYIQELRNQGVLCFLATNNEKYRFQYMLDKLGFAKSFDKTYSSANLGHQKPSSNFFSKIWSELHAIQKSEILFVDDDIKNIKGAQDFGFHTEHFKSLESLKRKIVVLNTK
ncbi:MAG: HAD-IA family hydrolase [Candidatus Paceibacterota bacterium]